MQSKGTIRIYDGLYIGDQNAARDEEFLLLNHVELVVNMTGDYLSNYFQHYDIRYISVKWSGADVQNWTQICEKMEQIREMGGVVLLHGYQTLQEPAVLSALSLMKKFRWSLYKTLEFMQSRLPNLALGDYSFQLLKTAELNLLNEENKLSYNWETKPQNEQEVVIRNTFLNCRESGEEKPKMSRMLHSINNDKGKIKRVSWDLIFLQKFIPPSSASKSLRKKSDSQEKLKKRIIMSVRRILEQSSLKQIVKTAASSQQSAQTQPSSQLTKHKSSYALTNFKSRQKTQQGKKFINSESSQQSKTEGNKISLKKERLQTEQIQVLIQSRCNRSAVKTQGQQISKKMVIDVHLPKTAHFVSCKSFSFSQQKQNLVSSESKLSLRCSSSRKLALKR